MAEGVPAAYPEPGYVQSGPIALVHLTRTFAAPRQRVFRAWTEPEAVRRWFGSRIGSPAMVEADVRVGGSYRITLKWPPVGPKTQVVGTFLEVDPPRRLVYTFAWKNMPTFGMGDSKVTVEFHEVGEGTEVRLTHELLDRLPIRAYHRWGWNNSMKRLARIL